MRFQYSLVRCFFFFFLVVCFCNANEQIFEVVGVSGDCVDCKENSFMTKEGFSGLHVTIFCKVKTGKIERVGQSALDQQGKFKISLPQEFILLDEQKLKEDCYAQVDNGAATPCPTQNDRNAPKIMFKSQTTSENTFGTTKNLQFSAPFCTSKFLWPYFEHPFFSWKNKFPKLPFPLAPFSPISEPRSKPLPPPPPTPILKPKLPKKQLPPPVPVSKPKPRPPVGKKLLPPPIPLYPLPPFYKKPCPPLPKILPNYFPHPKFGFFPPFPPFYPHP